ncbi:MAG: FG-GAP-like repeat-containing protein, partial [Blastocatellia bacterium]
MMKSIVSNKVRLFVKAIRPRSILPALAVVALVAVETSFIEKMSASVGPNAKASTTRQTGESKRIHLRAAGRGAPWINLSDGYEVPAVPGGEQPLAHSIEADEARPLSLASADFDGDGVPDLAVSLGGGGGLVSIYSGNADSINPYTPEARQREANGQFVDSPFLSPVRRFALPVAAEFIAAGDFNNDLQDDVVVAARGATSLYLLEGDGKGNLGLPKEIGLPGTVTALIAGEINRRDGKTDVVVAVAAASGPRALIFSNRAGAFSATPEIINLPAAATSLALGQLDDGFEIDLAIAAGRELLIVAGRDPSDSRSTASAKVERQLVGSGIRSLTVGDFTDRDALDVALLGQDGSVHLVSAGSVRRLELGVWPTATGIVTARSASVPIDNLVLVDAGANKLDVIIPRRTMKNRDGSINDGASLNEDSLVTMDMEDKPVGLLPMRLNGDALDDYVILESGNSQPLVTLSQPQTTLTVINTNDSGTGSLRQAISDAQVAGADTILFNIPDTGLKTINLASLLPTLGEATTIDGTSQPGYAGAPLIELNGASAGFAFGGIDIFVGGSCVVKGLVINRFSGGAPYGNGVNIENSSNNLIGANYIGTDATGNADLGNQGDGVRIHSSAASNNGVGSFASGGPNLISGNNRNGVAVVTTGTSCSNNNISDNYIGTNAAGTVSLGNTLHGVYIENSPNTLVDFCVVSGNGGDGI